MITRIGVTIAGLLAAVVAGVVVGENDWGLLAISVGGVLLALVAQATLRHLAAICLVLVTLDLWMAPAGFKVSPMEQVGIVLAFSWLLVCWRKSFNISRSAAFATAKSYQLFLIFVVAGSLYAGAHYIYNLLDPYEPLAFGWKAASKTYAQVFGAFVAIVLATEGRLLLPLDSKRSRNLLTVFLIAVTASTLIGLARAILIGPEISLGLSPEEAAESERLFTVPFLNAYDSFYTLRLVGPTSVLVGSVFFFSRPADLGRALPLMLMIMGLFGSLLSGGRVALIFAVFMFFVAILHARRASTALSAAGFAAVVISILIVIPDSALKDAPWAIQRSVGVLRPDVQSQAGDHIQSSNKMRMRFFQTAWDYYSSGPFRLILFGRSIGQMDSSDQLSLFLGDENTAIQFAIKRLATHNGFTDHLLGWGAVGYLLIVAMTISCCVMLFAYMRRFKPRSHGSCWLFIAGFMMAFWLFYTHVGGTFIWPIAVVLVVIALSQTDGLVLTSSARPAKYITRAGKLPGPLVQPLQS